jgi:hypothetical protein
VEEGAAAAAAADDDDDDDEPTAATTPALELELAPALRLGPVNAIPSGGGASNGFGATFP